MLIEVVAMRANTQKLDLIGTLTYAYCNYFSDGSVCLSVPLLVGWSVHHFIQTEISQQLFDGLR